MLFPQPNEQLSTPNLNARNDIGIYSTDIIARLYNLYVGSDEAL
jgi:hypothetical protein